ncbi:MAG: phage tail terminator-like protein [Pseudomonadota bacterium]
MTQTLVDASLEAHLLTFGSLPETHWPNQDFDPPFDGGVFFEVDHIRSQPQRLTHGNGERIRGIMQVTIDSEKGAAVTAAEGLAELLVDHFPADMTLTAGDETVRVRQTPAIATGFQDGQRWRIAVSIFHETLKGSP